MRYAWQKDAQRCYGLAIDAIRERCVRNGDVKPIDDKERRQAEEGPCSANQLESVRGAA